MLSITCESEYKGKCKEVRKVSQESFVNSQMFLEIGTHGIAHQLIDIATVSSSYTTRTCKIRLKHDFIHKNKKYLTENKF